MKKSYPVNLKFTSLPLSKPKWQFFSGARCSQLMLSVVLQCRQKQNKQPKH